MTKDERIKLFRAYGVEEANIHPEIVECISWCMDRLGFFNAPASTKYHGNYEGGLFDHSRAVYEELKKLTALHELTWERPQSIFLIAFLHDLCKADQYIKTDNGYEYRKDCLLTGHGEKSVMLCNKLPISMTMEEIACIRYHMGAFVDSKEWSSYTGAIHQYPNVLWTHNADMMASHIIGV